jgi:excisionase family DNA binding protein
MQPPKLYTHAYSVIGSTEDVPPLAEMMSMTIRTACLLTNFSRDCIYDLLRDGQIVGFLMGRRRFIDAQSLRNYLAKRSVEPLTIRRGPNTRVGPRVGHHNRLSRKSSTDTTP